MTEAEELAVELGSPHIGVGLLLYGGAEIREETAGWALRECGVTSMSMRLSLPRSSDEVAGQIDPEALSAIGVKCEGVRAAVERDFRTGALGRARTAHHPKGTRRPSFTPDAKRNVGLALRATQQLHQHHVFPGHVLLGLLRLDNEYVSDVAERSGTPIVALSAVVLTRLAAI